MKKFLFYMLVLTALGSLFGLSPLSRPARARGVEASPSGASMEAREAMGQMAAAVDAREETRYDFLWSLIGKSRAQVLGLIKETPISISKGGLGFEQTGIRVWFDDASHNVVTRVGIVSAQIELNGVHVGDRLPAFSDAFGASVWDSGEEAHFIYGNHILVVRYYPPARMVSHAVIMDKLFYQGQYLPSLPV